MKDRRRSKRRGSGAAWLAVVATSALLLADYFSPNTRGRIASSRPRSTYTVAS